MTLDPGEGYLLEGKDYWSYSSKHEPIKESELGIRDMIGFLLSIQD